MPKKPPTPAQPVLNPYDVPQNEEAMTAERSKYGGYEIQKYGGGKEKDPHALMLNRAKMIAERHATMDTFYYLTPKGNLRCTAEPVRQGLFSGGYYYTSAAQKAYAQRNARSYKDIWSSNEANASPQAYLNFLLQAKEAGASVKSIMRCSGVSRFLRLWPEAKTLITGEKDTDNG